MQWTSDAPTEAGWYCWRDTDEESGLVLFDGAKLYDAWYRPLGYTPKSNGKYQVEWCGPILPPD